MVDGTGLENQRGATHREFESRPLRQNLKHQKRRPESRLFSLAEEGRFELPHQISPV